MIVEFRYRPNPNGAAVEIWELINNLVPHFVWHVIIESGWN